LIGIDWSGMFPPSVFFQSPSFPSQRSLRR
jgi:hypothetical protein